jgi:hypothetical protein
MGLVFSDDFRRLIFREHLQGLSLPSSFLRCDCSTVVSLSGT